MSWGREAKRSARSHMRPGPWKLASSVCLHQGWAAAVRYLYVACLCFPRYLARNWYCRNDSSSPVSP